MRKTSGFTYVEFLISIVIASILILTVVAIASIGHGSHQRVIKKAEVYNDIMYSFRMFEDRIHRAKVLKVEGASAPWVSSKIIVDNEAFGVYKDTSKSTRELVYLPDKDDETNREVLFFTNDPDLEMTLIQGTKSVAITLKGKKNAIPFDMATKVKKRVQ